MEVIKQLKTKYNLDLKYFKWKTNKTYILHVLFFDFCKIQVEVNDLFFNIEEFSVVCFYYC